jgi:hypothetical protein
MDDNQVLLVYGILSAVVTSVSLFILTRRLDRKKYLRPVIFGLLFGDGCLFLFGAGVFAFLIGGVLTGYLLAREVGEGWSQFRAGALNGLMVELSVVIANVTLLAIKGASWFLTTLTQNLGRPVEAEELLSSLGLATVLDVVFMMVVVGAGAMVGGLLRKAFAPKAPAQAAPAKA